MRVIFLKDVPETADAGEVKEVKNGYARNYLLPRGLAAPATPDQLQRIKAIEKAAHETRLKFSEEWEVVAEAIAGTTVEVEVRVGPSGRLFGSVTGRAIAEKLTEATGREIDHRQVLLGTAIHEPGDYPVNIRLYRDVQAEVIVSVIPEGYSPEEAAAMAALAEEGLPEALDDTATSDEDDEPRAEPGEASDEADEPAAEPAEASAEDDETSSEADEKKDEDA
ncbi:MAG: 50S ribosomal protein L9 [Chloroflexi bacterium]|nr:50S ribosomal protein L9 [Chloroflexota bacterium]